MFLEASSLVRDRLFLSSKHAFPRWFLNHSSITFKETPMLAVSGVFGPPPLPPFLFPCLFGVRFAPTRSWLYCGRRNDLTLTSRLTPPLPRILYEDTREPARTLCLELTRRRGGRSSMRPPGSTQGVFGSPNGRRSSPRISLSFSFG